MRRVRLRFADRVVEFVDRGEALSRLEEIARRGTSSVHVVYGPEGCGKTALLQQARLILEDHGYSVIYVSPLERSLSQLVYTPSLREIVGDVLGSLPEPWDRLAEVVVRVAGLALRRLGKPRLALLLDDVFQAIGLSRAEAYVKALLDLIEYPPGEYDKIVVMVASSEGLTRDQLGRHRWVVEQLLWNMDKPGLGELYEQLPGNKPGLDQVWLWSGGNPWMLRELYETEWRPGMVAARLRAQRGLDELAASLDPRSRSLLSRTLEDPDALLAEEGPEARALRARLVELNLVTRLAPREKHLWLDNVPATRDPVLGIGRHYAWQTPLHREAVRQALEGQEAGS